MENASKALIIAGAILLSILIIGLGMMIYNQAVNSIGNNGIDEQKAKAYNATYEAYMGPNISGANVRTLCDAVRNHNITTQDDVSLQIEIAGKKTASEINSYKATILSGKTYKVEVPDDGYDSKTGFITKISVTQN